MMFAAIENDANRNKMEQIWEMHKGLMLYIARQILDERMAEDAVSEACIKIMKNIHKIEEISSNQTRSYVVYITKSVSIDILRRINRQKEDSDEVLAIMSDGAPDILDEIVVKEGYHVIKDAIRNLPDNQKDVIMLYLVHGLTHEEIAKLLGITVNASKVRLHRAKASIKKKLGGGAYDNQQ